MGLFPAKWPTSLLAGLGAQTAEPVQRMWRGRAGQEPHCLVTFPEGRGSSGGQALITVTRRLGLEETELADQLTFLPLSIPSFLLSRRFELTEYRRVDTMR